MRFFTRERKAARVLVLGLDCADPHLVFEQFKEDLPTLSKLATQGTWGRLESAVPCITVPAWASMLSSRDPGVLGVYGFRNRADYSYDKMITANATAIKVPRIWDILSQAGRESVVIGVPQTYPVRPLNGNMVSCFLTPGVESTFTYPAVFKQEVLKIAPQYDFDVKDFRTTDKAGLLQRLFDLSENQFKVLAHTIQHKPWDFFMHVDMGVDRVHHGFWRFYDPQHRLYEQHSPFKNAIREYYKMMDRHIAALIELAGDDVTVLIVSDHGVTRMDGGICLNEWLWREGWLVLKSPPREGELMRFEDAEVDWSRTKAWGSGGYYGRVFLNVTGREPQGIIRAEAYEQVRDELAAALEAIHGAAGEKLNTRAIKPQDVYTQVSGIAPDLLVYFGDLHWRSVGSLGHGKHFTLENDTGPDDANHDTHGLFILYEPGKRGLGQIEGHQLMDIAPTLLNRMGVAVPN
ncbi:MAG: alkaline phosphatase family protein, partial [Chitinophagaceae bacterium]|nr:alkaline phosphatase family protein [Anaerolineae bacterium]